jgi:hypothetical protein
MLLTNDHSEQLETVAGKWEEESFQIISQRVVSSTNVTVLSGASVAQSSELAPFTSENVHGFISRYGLMDSCEKSRSTLSRGFSPGAPVSSHR